MDCTLMILTFNGRNHLQELLPTLKKLFDNTYICKTNLIIVDNSTEQNTLEWIKVHNPTIKYEFSNVNDYLFSLNSYMRNIHSEFVLILNDDMKVHPDALNKLLPLIIADPSIFGVMCKIMDWDGKYEASGVRELRYSPGLAVNEWIKFEDNFPRYTLYGGGGATIFRTKMFNELGGFDTLFRPAYAEDLDLGHRAWQRGWKTVYLPEAILYHREGGTIKDQFKQNRLTQLITKNRLLWMIKDADKKFFLLQFFFRLPVRLLTAWRVDKNYWIALWKALPKMPIALLKRTRRSKHVLTDEQIMEMLGKPYTIPNIK